MSNGNGHHWSKFVWRDWHSDRALHDCSIAARGFWLELLCIMHEGAPVGHLTTANGQPATLRQMATSANITEREAKKLLAELEAVGVFSRLPDGTIYCRRMVKDAVASATGKEYAIKRWGTSKPNGSPNGSPNGEATREPNGVAIGSPIGEPIVSPLHPPSQKLEEREEKTPPVAPLAEGGGRRATGSNPRFLGTSPRGPKPEKNAFKSLERALDRIVTTTGDPQITIEGTPGDVVEFEAELLRLRGQANG